MSFRRSYFSLDAFSPLAALQRLLHPFRHTGTGTLRGGELRVKWTSRAERALRARGVPLPVEMQIYFSCVVKKRVLFPDRAPPAAASVGDDRFLIDVTTVESDRCDPVTFAAHYPARRALDSAGAKRMRARELSLDFRKGRWEGEFSV